MIIPMKKAILVALKEDKEALLVSLQKYGEMMLIPQTEALTPDADVSKEEALLQRTEKSLSVLKKYQGRKSSKAEVPTESLFASPEEGEAILSAVETALEEIQTTQTELQGLRERLHSLLPWAGMEENLASLSSLEDAVLRTGAVDPRHLEEYRALVSRLGGIGAEFGKTDNGIAVLTALFREDEPEFLEEAKAFGYVEIQLPLEDKTVSEWIEELETEIGNKEGLVNQAEEDLRVLSDQRADLGLLADQTATVFQRKKAALGETVETVYLEGWVRSDRLDRLEKAVRSVTDVYDLEFMDPPEGEKPPTVTKNNQFVDAFECVTDMFSKPDPQEIDPNPLMSFWYWLIFGMMMGDAGYGVVMILALGLMIKKTRPKGNTLRLLRVLYYTGYSTILWGILFGSYFGFTWNPIVLEPMAEPMNMLLLSVGIGVAHLFSGLLVKAWSNFKKRDYIAVYADSLAWILLIAGLGMMFLPATATIGKWVAILGAGSIVAFGGRSSKKIPGRIGLGLYSLYGASSYLGDILSYSRILALAMSSAALAMVMNMLAGMMTGGGVFGIFAGAIVFLIGHTFNLAMGLLSAYVHASRLQYIEFFGKFFTGGGIPFRPLEMQMNHVDVVNETI